MFNEMKITHDNKQEQIAFHYFLIIYRHNEWEATFDFWTISLEVWMQFSKCFTKDEHWLIEFLRSFVWALNYGAPFVKYLFSPF